MGRADYWKEGDWNAICDTCGAKYKASQLLLQWDNFRVCRGCWDPKHPQELQLPIPPPAVPAWTRPNTELFTELATNRVMDGAIMDHLTMG